MCVAISNDWRCSVCVLLLVMTGGVECVCVCVAISNGWRC